MTDKKEFTEEEKKAFAEKKKAELNAAYSLIDETAEKVFTKSESSNDLVKLLDIYSRFSYLGINNALLIFAQYPSAKEIHSVKYWNEHNYRAKKGQHSFALIERGNEYKKQDGSTGYSRNVVKYFDVGQTTAPYREPEVTEYASHALITALLKSCPIKYENYDPETATEVWNENIIAKYVPKDRVIYIRKNLEYDVFFRHFSTALVMAMLDRGGDFISNERLYMFDAKCISYLLCKKYNIDTSDFDFETIPSEYMNYDTTRIKSKLYEISEVNKNINEKMYKALQDVLKKYQESVDKASASSPQQDPVR